jgi:hypothetical protein
VFLPEFPHEIYPVRVNESDLQEMNYQTARRGKFNLVSFLFFKKKEYLCTPILKSRF